MQANAVDTKRINFISDRMSARPDVTTFDSIILHFPNFWSGTGILAILLSKQLFSTPLAIEGTFANSMTSGKVSYNGLCWELMYAYKRYLFTSNWLLCPLSVICRLEVGNPAFTTCKLLA